MQFTTANGTALLPGPYTFTALDKGRRVFSIKFQTTGPSQSLTATDQADPGLTGTRLDIMVM